MIIKIGKPLTKFFAAVAVATYASAGSCDASCMADYSDVKKIIKDMVRNRRKEDFEAIYSTDHNYN